MVNLLEEKPGLSLGRASGNPVLNAQIAGLALAFSSGLQRPPDVLGLFLVFETSPSIPALVSGGSWIISEGFGVKYFVRRTRVQATCRRLIGCVFQFRLVWQFRPCFHSSVQLGLSG